MASMIFNSFKKEVMDGTIDLDGNTFYCMLINTTGVSAADKDTMHYRSSFTTYEVTAGGTTGYTVGGTVIGTSTNSLTVSQDNTNDLAYWDAADATWTSAYITAYGAVVYKSNGTTDGTGDNLVCMFDFGGAQTATNGTFTVQWSTAGLLRLS